MIVLGIDPGHTESAYALIDTDRGDRPALFAKVPNETLLRGLWDLAYGRVDVLAIEMIESYGMAVGAEVFDTCVWIGRFQEAALTAAGFDAALLVKRGEVKMHLCGSRKAGDSNIIQALVDRYAYGQPNKGKGTKAEPGHFHGFAQDVWQAYALAVTVADQERG